MNDLCISLGDCGGYINFNGDYTDDGYTVSRAGGISGDQYRSCANYQPSQDVADPGDFGVAQILGIPEGLGQDGMPEASSNLGMLGAGMSGINSLKEQAAPASVVAKNALSFGDATTQVASNWVGALYPEYQLTAGQVSELSEIGTAALESGLSTNQAAEAVAEKGYEFMIANDMPPDMAAESSGRMGLKIIEKEGAASKTSGGFKLPKSFGNALAAIGAVLSIQSFLSAGFGLNDDVSWGVAGGVVVIAAAIQGLSAAVAWLGPIGLIISVIMMIAGFGDVKEKIVTFGCYPWQPPTSRDGQDCDRCNTNDPLDVPCSKYRCNSLGQSCEFINARTTEEKCIENNPIDVSSPRISPLLDTISDGYSYQRISGSGFEIRTNNDNCVPEYTVLEFGIETNQPAQCKIGTNVLDTYDEMFDYFGGRNLYLENHVMQIPMIGPNAFKNQYNLSDEQIEDLGELTFYVKCKSVNGMVNTIPHSIRTCVEPGPDLTAPRITKTEPDGFAYVAYGESEKNIQLWVNEPSSCRYSYEDKEDYELMENSFNCLSDVTDYTLYGWACETTLNGIEEGNSSKVYVKCRDQPWETDNNLRRTMSESYVYDLSVSKTELSIEDRISI